jgi:exodeoxyribonuclease-3
MKIATWNVNSIRAREPVFEQWAKESSADIILLQELKCIDEAFPMHLAENLGYNLVTHGQKTYNGVAILSKHPIEDCNRGFMDDPDPLQSRYIEAFTAGIRVASVYVPNGQEVGSSKFSYKLNFLKALGRYISSVNLSDEDFIIGGDFNVAPLKSDIHNPSLWGTDRILCSTAEQDALKDFRSHGLEDACQALDTCEFTWWDYRAGSFAKNAGYRIDHILTNSKASKKINLCGVDKNVRSWPKTSDHAPLWITMA